MPREIKRDANIRAAAAEQKRLRRAQMTEEELTKLRAVEAERARQKRAQLTEEELEKRRAKNAARNREKRLALKSNEELQRMKAIRAERTRQQRAQMTEEEIEERRIRDAANKREKRLSVRSEDELQEIRARDSKRRRQKYAQMTEEEREKAKAQSAEVARRKKAQMTEDELKKYKAQKAEYNRRKMATMTEEEIKRFKVKNAERLKRKLNGTTVERIEAFMSQAGELAYRHRAKYEIPGTFIKDSLRDILNLYAEVGKLRRNVRHTVAEAVKNALSLHQIEKQTRAEGYQSLTFVEISTRPLNSKRAIKQELITEDTEADPLNAQPVIPNQVCPSSEIPNQNSTNEQADETLKVCCYEALLGASAENSTGVNTSKKFECSICSKKFETSLGLTIHQKEHRDVAGEFKCCLCPQMFNDCNLMTTHYLELHSLEFNANEMNTEDEVEETDEVLERHRHEFEFSLLRKCLICFQTFDMERLGLSTYRNHIISDHSEYKELLQHFTYSCARCDKPFAVLRSLECHWKTFCYENWKNETWNNGGFVCEKCGMRFSNFKSLTSHTNLSHEEKKKVVCEQCGKEFNTEKLLKMHVKAMHEPEVAEYKFTCEHCGKAFKSRQSVVKHTKFVHLGEKRFMCKFCDKRFESNYKLDHHMITHTGEKPSGPLHIECDICGKTFKSLFNLKDHKYSHDSVKRFACSLCGKRFRQKTNYYHHKKKTHANENAQIVNIISEKEIPSDVFVNLLPTYNDVSSTLYNLPQRADPGTSKHEHHRTENCVISPQPQLLFPTPFRTEQNTRFFESELNRMPKNLFAIPKNSNVLSRSLEPYNIPERGSFNVPNVSLPDLPPQYSPGREDYSPEMEYDNEINEDGGATRIPQFEIGHAHLQNKQNNVSLPATNHPEHSTYLKPSVLETNPKHLQQSLPQPQSSMFIDFSRANVPLGISALTVAGSDTLAEKNISKAETLERNPQNLKLFVEDSEDSFIADVNIKDVVKIKIEVVDGFDKEFPKVVVKNKAAILAHENSSPCPIVKLTKLLEYNCVPCAKTIFAANQREIRKHRRAHPRIKKMRILKRVKVKKERSQKKSQKSDSANSTDKVKKFRMSCFDCLYCEKKNSSAREIIIHCSKEHPGQKPIKCPVCPSRMFNSINTYYNHKTKRHNEPKPKVPRDPNAKKDSLCELCGKGFYTKQDVWQHRSNMHRDDLNVECDICHKIVRGKGNLKLHKQRHLGIKPHLCEECGMGFCTPVELKNHVRVVHRGEKKTPITDKTHQFPCTHCPYRFVKQIGLQKHMDLHDPERKFVCDQCGFRFKTYETRFAHIKIKHKNIKQKRKRRNAPPPPDVFVLIP